MLIAACGGGARNTKLKKRVDQAHLAPVSAAERAAEAEAYRDVFIAEWQLAFTERQIRAAELEIKIAKNDLASAKIGADSADIKQKAAEEVDDLNRMKTATQAETAADLQIEMQKLSIARAKQSLAFLKKRLKHEKREHRRLQAKLELVRAESLSAAGIQPPNFNAKSFKAQFNERKRRAKDTRAAVDQELAALQAIEKKLAKAKAAAASVQEGGSAGAASEETPSLSDPFEQQPAEPEEAGAETTGAASESEGEGDVSSQPQPAETEGSEEGAAPASEQGEESSEPESEGTSAEGAEASTGEEAEEAPTESSPGAAPTGESEERE